MRRPASLIVGAAAAEVRRSLGPSAWCALEVLATTPPSPSADSWTVHCSVRELATRMGVAKNTAQRALTTLRRACLVELAQRREADGRFDASVYRLTVPDGVFDREPRQAPVASPQAAAHSPGPRRVGHRRPDRGGR